MAGARETCSLCPAIKAIAEEAAAHFVLLVHHPVRGLRDHLSEIGLAIRFGNLSRFKLRQSYQFIVSVTEADVWREFEVDCVGGL